MLLAIVACSSDDSRPGTNGDCVVVDGSICTTTVIGGSSSGSEGGTDGGSCTVSAGDSQCGVCANAHCCAQLEECNANTACTNLLSCEDTCGGASSCITSCEQQFPTGGSTLQLLTSCLTTDCPICDESGVGDPCSVGYPSCETGFTCTGLWCTKACVSSTDCAGIGAGGTNTLGYGNACITGPHGNTCAPGCGGSAGACADFPGTYCFMTTDDQGNVVSVCATLPDASTGD